MVIRLLIIWAALLWSPRWTCAEDWLTESRFEVALGRPLIATGDATPIRPFLEKLSQERQVAVLLDRRIDPSHEIRVKVNAASFDEGLTELAMQVGAGLSILGDTVYVGPPRVTDQLRTLVWMRQTELSSLTEKSVGRRFELTRRRPLVWEELAEPRQLVQQVTEDYGLTVQNPELLPHDVWGRGAIAHANATEALLLVLMQFDLAFEWTNGATGIRIVPAPERVSIVQEHVVPKDQRESIVDWIEGQFPQANVVLRGSRVSVDGTLEEHASIEARLRGERARRPSPSEAPLSRQRFTLKMVRDPAGSLLRTLQVQGVDVRFDYKELARAGVDLRTLVTMEFRQASIDQLLAELCRQVDGLSYRIDGETVFIEAGDGE